MSTFYYYSIPSFNQILSLDCDSIEMLQLPREQEEPFTYFLKQPVLFISIYATYPVFFFFFCTSPDGYKTRSVNTRVLGTEAHRQSVSWLVDGYALSTSLWVNINQMVVLFNGQWCPIDILGASIHPKEPRDSRTGIIKTDGNGFSTLSRDHDDDYIELSPLLSVHPD